MRTLLAALLALPTLVIALPAAPASPEAQAEPMSPEAQGDVASPEAVTEAAETEPSTPEGRPVVYRFELHDSMIDPATAFYFARAYARAEAADADAVIVDIDTPGGRLDSCIQVRNRIFESEIPTYAYITHWAISAGSLIALSTDRIYMGPNSSIGGSQPIASTGEGVDEAVNEKITSILRSEVRATMREQQHRDPDRWDNLDYQILLAEAFITPPDEDIISIYASPEVACNADELLTLDWEEAVRERIATDRCETIEDVLTAIGLEGAEVREVELTWSEKLARILSTTAVSSILLMIGLGGLYLEFKTPGLGLPGAIGLFALMLYFFGAYLADLSTVIEPLLVVTGFVLLAAEIFVIPGFGIAGLAGITCIVLGLLMALVRLPPPEFEFSMIYVDGAIQTVAVGLVLLIIAVILLAKYLPKTSLWRLLELEPAVIGGQTPPIPTGSKIKDISRLEGKEGVAVTDLRPAGKVEIDGDPFDVVTQGEFIAAGTPVRVLQAVGARIVVVKR
jgi:membrane-bound serine protease (ClpP class)